MLIQNWVHVLHVVQHTSLLPIENHDTDITRIRTWMLEGWAPYFRQTIMLSEFVSAEMNALFNRHCHNLAGKVNSCSHDESHLSAPKVYRYINLYLDV